MSFDKAMEQGSGISIGCSQCGTRYELTNNEVTCAPTPTEAAAKVMEAKGWSTDGPVCDKCLKKTESAGTVEQLDDVEDEEEDEEDEEESPIDELPVRRAHLRPVPGSETAPVPEPEPEPEEDPEPVVVFEEKDIRIVMTTDTFDAGPEPILVVERAHREKDSLGRTRWAKISLEHTVWVIQELARALFERETGQESPPQQRVWLGPGRYIPLANVIE